MSEHALRLAVVLPVLLLVLGGVLVAAKRGLIRLPGVGTGEQSLQVVQVHALGPGVRLAVLDFDGRRLLVGVGRDGVRLLAERT